MTAYTASHLPTQRDLRTRTIDCPMFEDYTDEYDVEYLEMTHELHDIFAPLSDRNS